MMSSDQIAAEQMMTAADQYTEQGIAQLQQAGAASAEFWLNSINQYDLQSNIVQKSQQDFQNAIAEQNSANRMALDAEYVRQSQVLKSMEKAAQKAAKESAAKVRLSAEQWAVHEARAEMVKEGDSIGGALSLASKTAALRQEATALAAQAISSANLTIAIAEEAERRSGEVPKAGVRKAQRNARELMDKQEEWEHDMDNERNQAINAGKRVEKSLVKAKFALAQAKAAETMAEEALETAKGNAEKINKLKARATDLVNKAQNAGSSL